MNFQKQQLNFLAFLSLVLFTILGFIIHWYFLPYGLIESLTQGAPYPKQILTGILYGLIASLISWQLIQSRFLKDIRQFFFKLLKPFHFKIRDILLISFSAGIGEEILFRGSIQPFLGIWLTALVFVMLHGYISYRNPQLSVYGIYMVVVAAGFGYLTTHVGLVSAIAAHTVIDIALLYAIANSPNSDNQHDELGKPSTNLTELSGEKGN